MHRSAYEYSSPLNNFYNGPPNRVPEFNRHYGQIPQDTFAQDPRFSPSLYNNTAAQINHRPDLYEGSNDTTLRAEERNWYIENHRNTDNYYIRNNETLPRTSKDQQKEDDKKQEVETEPGVTRRIGANGRIRRKEDRCSCECWPTTTPESTAVDELQQNNKSVNQSAVDMVASYGVYQNPHEDDDQSGFVRITNRGYPYQGQQQGVVVNEAGDSSVVPRGTEVVDNGDERNSLDRCCGLLGGGSNVPAASAREVDCWVSCCKPAIFLFLLVLMLVVFALVSGLLVYYNYMTYKPRQPLPEEPCEKTFCRWGASCVVGADMRAQCQCPARCPALREPVCSTDGRTYPNHCELRKESCERRLNTRVRHAGECEMSDPCHDVECPWGASCSTLDGRAACRCPRCTTRATAPACGSDGKEYSGACELARHACEQQANLTLVYHGKCDPCDTHQCPSPQVCQLDGARVPACRCGELCPLSLDPVCASDGRTYANECELRQEACRSRRQMRIIYRGKCSSGVNPCSSVQCGPGEQCWIGRAGAAACSCGADCEPVLRPVCARDGATHASACHLRRAACQLGRAVHLAHDGACGTAGPCANITCPFGGACSARSGRAACSCPACGAQLEPACGSDGRTYANECKLRERACQLANEQSQQRDILVLLYNGTCETCDEKRCELYGVCEMESVAKTKCVCPGNCSEADTAAEPGTGALLESGQVCGSDGRSYPSDCHLRSAACQAQLNISVAYQGDCALCENIVCKYGARCSAGECICPSDCAGSDAEPVCANTMATYSSECELQQAACLLPQGHKQLHVIFYGDCKDRFAVAGPPIALTTAIPLPFPPTLSEQDQENSTSLPGLTEYPEHSLSTLEQLACKDIHCDYDATCELGSDNFPRCSCLFDCPLDETSEDYFPVCASDMMLYTSMCAMRMEGCHKQIELRLRPLELCKGLESRPCAGGSPVRDAAGREVDCGGGPFRQDCPVGSYCHHAATSTRCCFKNETLQRKNCEESAHGCCPDQRTPAGGPAQAGCPSTCGCHRLGALADTCDPDSKQCACRPGVGGLRCDRCEPGYWGLPRIGAGHKGCIPCGCSMFGSVREDCEQMTGRCVCKAGIQGQKCTLCMNHEEVLGPNGCFNSETGAMAPASCSDIVCYFGAVCVEADGRAACQCPAASCPTDSTDPSMLVCGSDGQTYPSECHLKLQACRTQEDVVVQAFGICKGTEDITGTALPSKHYSPLQFTQQDDNNFPSKSTRHLLVPDPRNYYNNYGRGYEVSRDKDSTSSLDGDKGPHRGGFGPAYRPTPATVRAPPALVGDLCNDHADCLGVPSSRCHRAACVCQPGHRPAADRRECIPTNEDFTTTTEEPRACSSEPCMNFGTCIDLPEATFTCICDAQFTGELCQDRIPSQEPINYIETPSFDGRAYIRLKPLKAYHKLNIDVEFKSFSENGVVLYDQQKSDGTGDFVSLAIVNGFVEFRYNLGDGIVILTSVEKIQLNEYHKVSAKRYHRDGILSVDDHEDVVGQSTGSLKALDLSEDTFIGSVPTNCTRVFDNIGTKHGFTGCIKHLRVIRHQVTKKLGKDDAAILAMQNVRECTSNPCVSAPCYNGATCHANDDEELQYTCICSGSYKGARCEEKVDPCETSPCGKEEGVFCDSTPHGEFVCKCQYGGKLVTTEDVKTCSYEISTLHESYVPEFNGSSYLQLPKLDGLSDAFRIELWFLTKKLSGMLFYNSQSSKPRGDFISLNLVNGYLQFRFNLGSGIANISFPEKVTKDRWHKLRAFRTAREGTLRLDEWPAVKGNSAPPLTELNLGLPVFLGSVPSHIKPHRLSGITSSFVGAIQQVFVNSIPLILYNEDTPQCSMLPNEEVLPCATVGTSRYSGFPCSHSSNPCQHNGACVPMLNEYKCICKDGFEGRNCETKLHSEITDNNTPVRFNGEAYFAYRSRGGRRKLPERGMRLDIKFRTTESSGLLIWRRKGGIGQGDFLALGIIDGHAELIYSDYSSRNISSNRKDRWYSTVRSRVRVDDGLWHTVVIKRRKKMSLIQTDDQPSIRGYTQLPILTTKANPKLWIGGAPSLPHGLPPQLYLGLKGCVVTLKSNGRPLNLHHPLGSVKPIEQC